MKVVNYMLLVLMSTIFVGDLYFCIAEFSLHSFLFTGMMFGVLVVQIIEFIREE